MLHSVDQVCGRILKSQLWLWFLVQFLKYISFFGPAILQILLETCCGDQSIIKACYDEEIGWLHQVVFGYDIHHSVLWFEIHTI